MPLSDLDDDARRALLDDAVQRRLESGGFGRGGLGRVSKGGSGARSGDKRCEGERADRAQGGQEPER
ncbi:hypothetical protein GCM10012286_44920 [Streptomyces lasiicapitis]|uniref:Uncharacterized protein n=1 Tax=Streptomyces lasiicapitis TaxID=1923961 RepID=A0ABQ2MA64_9ACTN|nr:hypothetical protein GCM10012286_44920 [Streptomyces lasiicapitis]